MKNIITNTFRALKRVYNGNNSGSKYGIHYNESKVSKFMHFQNYDFYVNLLENTLIKTGKTLLYLASGTEQLDRFKDLEGYSNIILVDYEFNDCITIDMDDNKRIIHLNLDAYIAIQVLLMLNHTIDTVVILNEGVNMGGGNMTIGENALALLYPVLSEETMIICSRKYYKMSQVYKPAKKGNWINLPFETKVLLKSEDAGYINPDFFTTYDFCKGIGEVYLLKNKITTSHTFQRGRINVHVLHSSMYNHLDKIDLGLTLFENGFQEEIIRTGINNVLNWKGIYKCSRKISKDITIEKQYDLNNIDELNQLCIDKNVTSLGLIPSGIDYLQFIDDLNNMENSIEDIYFFHLHHGDLKSLYAIQ
jgi:hypothetical protein